MPESLETLDDILNQLNVSDTIEIISEFVTLVERISWAWVLAMIPAGLVFLYFGYRLFEILKFVAGFVIGGVLAGAIGYAYSGEVGAILGFTIGGAALGALFVRVINMIPVVIGAVALAVPWFAYLRSAHDLEPGAVLYGLTAVAAALGGVLGNLIRIVVTVAGTAFLGTTLIIQSAARIHVELVDLPGKLRTEELSYFIWLAVLYGLLFLCLFCSGSWVQLKEFRKTSSRKPSRVASAPPATSPSEQTSRAMPRLEGEAARSLGVLLMLLIETSSQDAVSFIKISSYTIMARVLAPKSSYLDVLEDARTVIQGETGVDQQGIFREQASLLKGFGSESDFRRIVDEIARMEHRMNDRQLTLVRLMKEMRSET